MSNESVFEFIKNMINDDIEDDIIITKIREKIFFPRDVYKINKLEIDTIFELIEVKDYFRLKYALNIWKEIVYKKEDVCEILKIWKRSNHKKFRNDYNNINEYLKLIYDIEKVNNSFFDKLFIHTITVINKNISKFNCSKIKWYNIHATEILNRLFLLTDYYGHTFLKEIGIKTISVKDFNNADINKKIKLYLFTMGKINKIIKKSEKKIKENLVLRDELEDELEEAFKDFNVFDIFECDTSSESNSETSNSETSNSETSNSETSNSETSNSETSNSETLNNENEKDTPVSIFDPFEDDFAIFDSSTNKNLVDNRDDVICINNSDSEDDDSDNSDSGDEDDDSDNSNYSNDSDDDDVDNTDNVICTNIDDMNNYDKIRLISKQLIEDIIYTLLQK